MQVFALSASLRSDSKSQEVARVAGEVLRQRHRATIDHFSLASTTLSSWGDGVDRDEVSSVSNRLVQANAILLVVPEWNGGVPGGLLNFFLHFSPLILGNKPVLIVAVSASVGGAYPVSELRLSCYKNTRLLYLPEHIIVRNVSQFLENVAANHEDYTYGRLVQACDLLAAYAGALQPLVAEPPFDFERYPNGM